MIPPSPPPRPCCQASDKQVQAQAALAAVPELEAQVELLSRAVDYLDVRSLRLAAEEGVPEPGGTFSAWGAALLGGGVGRG